MGVEGIIESEATYQAGEQPLGPGEAKGVLIIGIIGSEAAYLAGEQPLGPGEAVGGILEARHLFVSGRHARLRLLHELRGVLHRLRALPLPESNLRLQRLHRAPQLRRLPNRPLRLQALRNGWYSGAVSGTVSGTAVQSVDAAENVVDRPLRLKALNGNSQRYSGAVSCTDSGTVAPSVDSQSFAASAPSSAPSSAGGIWATRPHRRFAGPA
eukprot:323674-Pyramimonas_sp.AAC.2